MTNADWAGGGNRVPSYQRDQAKIWSELRKLWKKVGPQDDSVKQDIYEVIWSYGGTVNPVQDVIGQKWIAPFDGILTQFVVTLAAASSLDIVIQTRLRGSGISNVTLAAGDTQVLETHYAPFEAGDSLQPFINVTSDGTGISLGMMYRYVRP